MHSRSSKHDIYRTKSLRWTLASNANPISYLLLNHTSSFSLLPQRQLSLMFLAQHIHPTDCMCRIFVKGQQVPHARFRSLLLLLLLSISPPTNHWVRQPSQTRLLPRRFLRPTSPHTQSRQPARLLWSCPRSGWSSRPLPRQPATMSARSDPSADCCTNPTRCGIRAPKVLLFPGRTRTQGFAARPLGWRTGTHVQHNRQEPSLAGALAGLRRRGGQQRGHERNRSAWRAIWGGMSRKRVQGGQRR